MEFRGPSIARIEHVSEVQNHRSLRPVNHGAWTNTAVCKCIPSHNHSPLP